MGRGKRSRQRIPLQKRQRKDLKEFGEFHPSEYSRDITRKYSKVEDAADEAPSASSSEDSENEEETAFKQLLSLVGASEAAGSSDDDDDDDDDDNDDDDDEEEEEEEALHVKKATNRKKTSNDATNTKATKRKKSDDATKTKSKKKRKEIVSPQPDSDSENEDDILNSSDSDEKEDANGEEKEDNASSDEEDEDDDEDKVEGEEGDEDKKELEEGDDEGEMQENGETAEDEEVLEDGDSDIEEDLLLKEDDPFSIHFEHDMEEETVDKLTSTKWSSKQIKVKSVGEGRLLYREKSLLPKVKNNKERDLKKMGVKHKLVEQVAVTNQRHCRVSKQKLAGDVLTPLQHGLFSMMNKYQDVLYPRENLNKLDEIRLTYCLHSLNHVLKTRSRVVAHNTKLKMRKPDQEELEYRDQGLARPKVLIVLPTRNAAYRVVTLIISLLSASEQVMVSSRKRFKQEYGRAGHDDDQKGLKPEDFDILFAGNADEDFRIGLSVAKKSLRLYSPFYMSDIIIASPLSLHRTIGHANDKDGDYDFLCSIEILVLDQTEFFCMQNWDHIVHLMKHMHLQPKQSRGYDISRVRLWTLNGWSQHYRQTVIFSWFLLPPILTIANKFCHNFSGKIQFDPKKTSGSICQIVVQLPQMFHKIECDKFADLRERRWEYFLREILPLHREKDMKNTLIFIPDYFDYCRLRNYFHKEAFSFAHISEYAESKEIRAARRTFRKRKAHFLLYTERLHFYRRFKLRGPRHIIFYELPQNPHFYSEMCNMLEEPGRFSVVSKETLTCTVLYSRFEALKLRQVVGTSRADHMLQADKIVHMMVSGDAT